MSSMAAATADVATTTKVNAVAAAPVMMDVRSCTSEELALSLLERYNNNSSSGTDCNDDSSSEDVAVKFLQETIQYILDKKKNKKATTTATTTAAEPSAPTSNTTTTTTTFNLGTKLLTEPFEGSFITPRLGKCSFQLYEHGIQATKLNDPSTHVVLPASSSRSSSISHVLVFPKPEDCKTIVKSRGSSDSQKKTTGRLVLVRLDHPTKIIHSSTNNNNASNSANNKEYQEVCFTLPFEKKVGPIGPKPVATAAAANNTKNNDDPTSLWCQLLQQSLSKSSSSNNNNSFSLVHIQPESPSSLFQSYQPPNTSTTSGGMPFITCYHGVNDGVVFPLQEGLLFYKPIRFFPRNQLVSINSGRGNSSSSSRYVDMQITLKKKESDAAEDATDDEDNVDIVEFTNIQREENPGLNSYIHNVLIPAMQKDCEERADDDDVVTKSVTKEDDDPTSTTTENDEDATDDEDEDDYDHSAVEAADVAVEHDDEEDDTDEDDEDFESEDSDDDEEEDAVDNDDNDEDGFEVVPDDYARSLVNDKKNEKKKQRSEDGDDKHGSSSSGSSTESESDSDDDDKPRTSKRLRRQH